MTFQSLVSAAGRSVWAKPWLLLQKSSYEGCLWQDRSHRSSKIECPSVHWRSKKRENTSGCTNVRGVGVLMAGWCFLFQYSADWLTLIGRSGSDTANGITFQAFTVLRFCFPNFMICFYVPFLNGCSYSSDFRWSEPFGFWSFPQKPDGSDHDEENKKTGTATGNLELAMRNRFDPSFSCFHELQKAMVIQQLLRNIFSDFPKSAFYFSKLVYLADPMDSRRAPAWTGWYSNPDPLEIL